MPRRRFIVLTGVALAIVGGIYAWKHVPRDTATKATVGEAVRQFRQTEETEPGRNEAGVPEPGVYRYRVRGGESMESAFLGGASHDYSGVATIAITPDSCGVEERWQVLAERWTEDKLCLLSKADRLQGVRDSHEFFGQTNQVSYTCQGDLIPNASELRPRMRWTTKCASDSGSVVTATRTLGLGKVRVAGRMLPAAHTRSHIALHGEVSGTDERDEWLRRADGLLLRRRVDAKTSVDIVGGARYREDYSLRLLSPKPER